MPDEPELPEEPDPPLKLITTFPPPLFTTVAPEKVIPVTFVAVTPDVAS